MEKNQQSAEDATLRDQVSTAWKISSANETYPMLFLILTQRHAYWFLERGEGMEREREQERNIDWLPIVHVQTGNSTGNIGMCPDWESNPWPFSLQDDTPTNWATVARAISHAFIHVVGNSWNGPFLSPDYWKVSYLSEYPSKLKSPSSIPSVPTTGDTFTLFCPSSVLPLAPSCSPYWLRAYVLLCFLFVLRMSLVSNAQNGACSFQCPISQHEA